MTKIDFIYPKNKNMNKKLVTEFCEICDSITDTCNNCALTNESYYKKKENDNKRIKKTNRKSSR